MSSVSVVMATYNGAEYIGEQLRSLSAQSTLPGELIVSDDGSVDDTLEIVRQFRERARFPVHIQQNAERLGYGENFLKAADSATGEYIAFCDQDDLWHPDKIAVSLRALTTSGAELFVHTASVIDRSGQRVGRFRQGIRSAAIHPPLHLPPWSVFYGCTMMFPRRLLTLLDATRRGPHTFEYQGLLSHDLWVYFLASTLGRVITDTRPLLAYRQHGGNATPGVLGTGVRRWVRSLGTPAHPGSPRAAAAAQRALLLAELGESTDDSAIAQLAARAAWHWTTISHHERARLDMYASPKAVERLGRCIRLVQSGAYSSFRRGGLGGRLLVKDLLVGLLCLSQGPE